MLKTLSSFIIFGLFASALAQDISINDQVTMLALGDSYTIGASVATSERWPHQFIDELRTMGVTAEYPDYIAATGWTTRRLLQAVRTRLEAEKDYNLVSILIGVNNQYQGLDIYMFEPDLIELIERGLEQVDQDTSRVFILSIPDYAYTPFGGGSASISREIDEYNAIKQRVAASYNMAYVDITPISRLGLGRPELVAGDGLHPSGQQYREWVEQIIPRLKPDFTPSSSAFVHSRMATLSVYPNPSASEIYISSIHQLNQIRLINAQGSIVKDVQVQSMHTAMDLSQLPPGSYILIASPADASLGNIQRHIIRTP